MTGASTHCSREVEDAYCNSYRSGEYKESSGWSALEGHCLPPSELTLNLPGKEAGIPSEAPYFQPQCPLVAQVSSCHEVSHKGQAFLAELELPGAAES